MRSIQLSSVKTVSYTHLDVYKRQERVGLVAPSGFGKTTLCKILSGYEKPDSGQVLLDGKPLDFYGSYCPVQLIWQHPEQAIKDVYKRQSGTQKLRKI